jgi:hypothetical protein
MGSWFTGRPANAIFLRDVREPRAIPLGMERDAQADRLTSLSSSPPDRANATTRWPIREASRRGGRFFERHKKPVAIPSATEVSSRR